MRYAMRAITTLPALLTMLVTSALLAQEGPLASNAIEIRVDTGAFDGPGTWPLGVGVPIPKGRMKPGSALRLRGEKQGVLPAQVTEKTRWQDGSVQWIWVDFQGDPRDKYFLDLSPSAEQAPAPEPAMFLPHRQAGQPAYAAKTPRWVSYMIRRKLPRFVYCLMFLPIGRPDSRPIAEKDPVGKNTRVPAVAAVGQMGLLTVLRRRPGEVSKVHVHHELGQGMRSVRELAAVADAAGTPRLF